MTPFQRALVEENRAFAYSYAERYRHLSNHNVQMEDIRQQAVLGMCEAARRYDPEKGVKFISYAVFWVRQSINRYLCFNYSTVRPPSSRNRIAITCEACYEEYHDREHVFTCPHCGHAQHRFPLQVSYDMTHRLVSEKDAAPDTEAEREGHRRFLEKLLYGFTDTEKKILWLYQMEGLTLDEVGQVVGMTKEGVRQRYLPTLARLKKRVRLFQKTGRLVWMAERKAG